MKFLHSVRPAAVRLVLALWVQAACLPAETRFHHLHLNATDPPAVYQFFAGRFAGKLDKLFGQIDGFDTGRGWILAQKREIVNEAKTAFWHLGWGAVDFRSAYIRLLDLGTRFAHPAEHLTPELDFAYAAGPHGLLVELNTAKADGLGHIHLWSAHPAVAGEWYQRLGLKPTRPLDEKPLQVGRYSLSSAASLDADGVRVLIFPKPDDVADLAPNEGTLVDHLAFQVDDLDRKLLDLRKSGTRILEPPRELLRGVRGALVQGPDRLRIELIEVQQR